MHAAHTVVSTRAVLAAAALALAACSGSSGPTPPPACEGLDQPCGSGAECCSGSCPAGACACSALGAVCGTSEDCCDGTSARRCEGGACVSGCRPVGDVCGWEGDCCSLNCDVTGHCAQPCLTFGASCAESAQCCGYLGCPAGTCTGACASSGSCTSSNQCCSDYRCRAGECQYGVCGTTFHSCATAADCCTAANGGKDYFCNGYGECDLGDPGDACTTDADCHGSYPCRGGYCRWPDGSQPDGSSCLDGQECDSGICTSTAAGVPGSCCSGAGTGCTAGGWETLCCAPYTCTGTSGAQSCGTCLDFTNSGPQGSAETQCTRSDQCCAGRDLTCVGGECCTRRNVSCAAASECCGGATCGDVTTYAGTTPWICCGDFEGSCTLDSPCCDGYLCKSGTCLKEPGQPCSGSGQCAEPEVECNAATGTCCSHTSGPCETDADCCSLSCDTANGRCNAVPEYGSCLDDDDCFGPDYNQDWNGQVCGGNANLGPGICCPVPGDTCLSAADCCEVEDSCKVPYDGSSTSALCCRETPAACSQDSECCTGTCWSHYVGGSPVGTCCAYPYLTTFACASDADCCDSSTYSGVSARAQCGDDVGVMRCCSKAGQPAYGDAAVCCSGRIDQVGYCR